MRRAARIAAAIVTSMICGAIPGFAQGPPPEGWVVLSVDEYQALRNRSLASDEPRGGPPIAATLSRVDYDLHLESDSVVGQALLTVDVLRDGWARIAIPAGLLIGDARVNLQPGQRATLSEGPSPHLLVSQTGRSLASLDIVMPVTLSAGTESIVVPPSSSSIVRVTLALPRIGMDLSVAGGYVAEHVETNGDSRWTLFGRPNEAMTVTWKRRVDDRRSTLPLRTRARIVELVGYGEETCQVSAAVAIEIVQGVTQEIALALPPGLGVNQVTGATIADWQTDGTTLRVRFLEPVLSDVSFNVETEMRVPREGKVAVPIIRMPAAERETGGIAVDIVGAGEIADRLASGLEPADTSELGAFVANRDSPSLVAFRSRPLTGTDARNLTVTIVRYTPQPVLVANIEDAQYRALATEDRVLVEAQYVVRNNQRSFLKIALPSGARLWSASVDGQPIRPGVADDGAVLLPLAKGRAGEDVPVVQVKLVYVHEVVAWRDRDRVAFELPAVDLPTSRTGFRLYYPPRFTITPEPGAFRMGSDSDLRTAFGQLAAPSVHSPSVSSADAAARAGLKTLVDQFRKQVGDRKAIGRVPVDVAFPAFGPSVFLAAELTAEGRAPSVGFVVRRVRD